MRRTYRVLRLLIGVVLLGLVVQSVRRQAGDFTVQPVVPRIQWAQLGLGFLLVVAGTFGFALASTVVVRSWRERIRFVAALRLWTRLNLLAWLPEGMAVDRGVVAAERLGITSETAAGAVIFPRLIALAMAAVAGLTVTSVTRFASSSLIAIGADFAAILCLLAPLALTRPIFVWRFGMHVNRASGMQPIEPDALGVAMIANLVAWMIFGYALMVIAGGALAGVDLAWPVAIGGLALAEAAGEAFPVLPAGLVVRDAIVFLALKGTVGIGPAAALAVLWRLARLGADLVTALPFASSREPVAQVETPSPVELTTVTKFPAPDSRSLLGSGPPAVTLVRDDMVAAPVEPAAAPSDRTGTAAWQAKHPGTAELQRRIKELEDENARLKRMNGELALRNAQPRTRRRRPS
ncbi:MAG: hypothetical protein ACREL5_12950 [Gemmatimonadales bacterium]